MVSFEVVVVMVVMVVVVMLSCGHGSCGHGSHGCDRHVLVLKTIRIHKTITLIILSLLLVHITLKITH